MDPITPKVDKSEWKAPPFHAAPAPTAAPFVLAIGITLLFWGIVTSWLISLGGGVMLVWALGSWLRDIGRDWRRHDNQAG